MLYFVLKDFQGTQTHSRATVVFKFMNRTIFLNICKNVQGLNCFVNFFDHNNYLKSSGSNVGHQTRPVTVTKCDLSFTKAGKYCDKNIINYHIGHFSITTFLF